MNCIKFTFPNISGPAVRKGLTNRNPVTGNKKVEKKKEQKVSGERRVPFFYNHKIRAPRYEFF